MAKNQCKIAKKGYFVKKNREENGSTRSYDYDGQSLRGYTTVASGRVNFHLLCDQSQYSGFRIMDCSRRFMNAFTI